MSWKTTTAVFISLMMAALLVSCADVPSTGPTPPEFKAEYRVINADAALSGGAVTVDNATAGSLTGAGSATSYQSWDSGSRAVKVNNETITVSMDTDWKGSIVLLPQVDVDGTLVRSFMKVNERRIFDSPVSQEEVEGDDGTIQMVDTPRLRMINATDVTVDVSLQVAGEEVAVEEGIEPEDYAGYYFVEAVNYTLVVTDHDTGDELTTISTGSLSPKRYTALVWGAAGSVAGKTLADD
ncbi:MAG: hypothetical protein H6696_19175 [Deferribacteres bacterium]|nr:hypothetical protein [candidate division KSB1 bacterium]MCB9504053.1 hypothetical protein [Deferribacteres bacterium]